MFSALYVLVLCAIPVMVLGYDNDTVYTGLLTPDCVRSYYRVYVTGRVPPRNYQYYHETQTQLDRAENPGGEVTPAADTDLQFRIVGGTKVSITDAPYTVLYGRWCGGTLIAPEWVLTAAHCSEKESYILAGSTMRSLATRYPICAHFTHPLWESSESGHTHDWDFQVVLLEKPVPITLNSRPVAIGNLDDIQPGEMVAVTGWGHLKYKDKMQDNLRRVYVPIMPQEECKTLPKSNYRNITTRMFCAGYREGNKDSCQGDSGGPAVSRGRLLGIVSFGVGCAARDQPGVYAAVPRVRSWLRAVTALPL